MKYTAHTSRIRPLIAALSTLASLAGLANAAVTITFTQDGQDILVIGSGSLDVSSLTELDQGNFANGSISSSSTFNLVRQGNGFLSYFQTGQGGLNNGGPTILLNEALSLNGLGSGSNFGILVNSNDTFIIAPDNFTTGTINGQFVIANTQLSMLGVVNQTISWGVGSGESLIINAVPEPSTTLIFGIAGLFLLKRRFRK